MNGNDMHRAYRQLRQRAPDEDKEALIERLHRQAAPHKPALLFHWFERFKRPEFAGLAMASVLTMMVAVGVPMYQRAGEFVPQVDEMDYDGGQAMVIEDKTQHTTLIWLSDADDDNEDEDEHAGGCHTREDLMLLVLASCTFLAADMPAAPGPAPAAAASQPASQPVTVELRVRVATGSKKGSMLDPRLADLYGSLKDFVYTSYSVKDERTLSIELHGQTKISLPDNRTVIITVKEYKPKGRPRVRVRIEIPELKFATETTIGSGGTLVVGGPKIEDGVLLFAVGVTKLTPH